MEAVNRGNLEPLFLTPLIRAGKESSARDQSKVGILPGGIQRESYSGFITLNQEFNTNTFFWFFPAKNKADTAPVILWIEGGCGISFFISLFTQNGPFKINSSGSNPLAFREPEFDWTKDHSVIYVENPIGTGYSFTEDKQGYSTSSEQAAEGIYEFLEQFFVLFPDFGSNPFYIAAFSFGGHFAAPLTTLILQKNKEPSIKIQLNLQSVLLFGPWIDPSSHVADYGNYLYNLGLITETSKDHFDQETSAIIQLIKQEEFLEAKHKLLRLIAGMTTYFVESTGFLSPLSVLEDRINYREILTLLNLSEKNSVLRKAIHVGNQAFTFESTVAKKQLEANYMSSVNRFMEDILNQDIPILIVSAQMDIRVPHLGIQSMISKLKWKGSQGYKDTERRELNIDKDLAGYVKSSGGLTYVMLRNAGHMMIRDQMKWSLDLVRRTVNGIPL